MTTSKTFCRIQRSILYPTCLLRKFVGAVLLAFADTFVDTLSAAFTILSQVITERSIELGKYSPFSQLYIAGF